MSIRGVFVGETSERETVRRKSFAMAWGDNKKLCYGFEIKQVTGKFPSSQYTCHPDENESFSWRTEHSIIIVVNVFFTIISLR